MAEIRSAVPLLIAFVDLTRFGAQSQRTDDLEIAETIDAYYEHVGAAVRAGGGSVVKFEGDAALIVFPATAVDRGVEALLDLKDSVDDLRGGGGGACRLIAKVHFGTVIAGPFGAAGDKRPDVIGRAVNITAMLEATGVTLSVEAFRKLGRGLRARFKKHTPPITYIRLQDPHRSRSATHA
jgi:class 3 adenylate cyclase